MGYSGGCLFGYPFLISGSYLGNNKLGGDTATMAGQTPAAVSAHLVDAYGETKDGCWLPAQWAVNYTASNSNSFWQAITDITRTIGGGDQTGLLLSWYSQVGANMPRPLPADVHIYQAADANSALAEVSATVLSMATPLLGFDGIGQGRRFLITDLPYADITGIEGDGKFAAWAANGGRFGELIGASLVELPQNQELTSFSREISNPTMQTIRTLDGSKRSILTGPPSVKMSATWRWSDDGTTAARVQTAIQNAATYGTPLVVYIPGGIWYQGPFLDYVWPDNIPAVTMPAPGVYEITISGECQP